MQGLPNSTATQQFAEALFNRIPRASAAPNAYQQQERMAAALSRQNAKYTVLSDDEDFPDEPPPAPTTAAVPAKRPKKGRQKPQVGNSCWLYGAAASNAMHLFNCCDSAIR